MALKKYRVKGWDEFGKTQEDEGDEWFVRRLIKKPEGKKAGCIIHLPSGKLVSDEELARQDPDSFCRYETNSSLSFTSLGETREYQRAIKNYPPGRTTGPVTESRTASKSELPPAKEVKEQPEKEIKPNATKQTVKKQSAKASAKKAAAKSAPHAKGSSNEVISNIQELAKANGIDNAFQLWQRVGGSKESAAQLWRGDFKMISTATLGKLCGLLDCGPGDLLTIEKKSTGKRKR